MIKWANINNLKISSDEILLSGFKKFGCIGSLGYISFDKVFKFNAKFKYSNNPLENAAIVDIDFAHSSNYHSFSSLIYQNKNLIIYIKNDDTQLKLWEGCPIDDYDWHDLHISVDQKVISYYIDDNMIASYEFDNMISPCEIFLGGNNDDKLVNQKQSPSIYIKNISVETDSGIFPLNKEELGFLKDNKLSRFFKKMKGSSDD